MDPELLPGSESGVIVQQNMKGQINKNGKQVPVVDKLFFMIEFNMFFHSFQIFLLKGTVAREFFLN